MTLEEKVDQITGGWEGRVGIVDPTGTFTAEDARKTLLNEWGEEQKFTPRQSAILRNGVQRYQLEKTRLGIPEMFLSEGLHGVMEYGSTSFPQALGLAATWDPALVKRVFTAVGDEAGSRGLARCFRRSWTLRAIRAGAAPKRRTAKILTWSRAWAWPPLRACKATTS
jgi:beta-glucosidase